MSDDSPFKLPVTVRLMVGDIVFAESKDEALWKRVLNAMASPGESLTPGSGKAALASPPTDQLDPPLGSDPISRFAADVGVARELVEGALGPATDAPYLHLDNRCWEAFQKNTAPRGSGAVAPIVFAATALFFWAKYVDLNVVKPIHAQRVLGTINVVDKNPTRGVTNCDWLLKRNGGIVVNPAQISRAARVVRAFCTKQPISAEAD